MKLNNIIELIKKRWLEYSTNPPTHHVPSLSAATPEKEHGIMTQALLFWKFVRNRENFMDQIEGGETLETIAYAGYTYNELKRAFLEEFICDNNKYIMYIVYVESMPTSIWRKILWRYNIDFQDYEPFLRRLSYDQIHHIMNNYNDMKTTGKKPRVLKLSLRDRIKFAFSKDLNQKLLEEDLFDNKRYVSKAAWAYSLLGLDFGFGKYPDGVNSDFELQNRKLSRFLSTKNHINDFVVNQEDNGLYWLLYRKARKNFVWKSWSKKEVELKHHICPGFWATLTLHLIFWVISPLIFINGAQNLISHHFHFSWYNSLFLGIGCITPLWICIAAIKLLWYTIGAVLYLIFGILIGNERLKKARKWIEDIVGPGFLVIFIVVVASLVIKFMYWLPDYWLEHTYLHFGNTSVLAFIMTSLVISSIVISALEHNDAMEYPEGKKYVWTPFIWAVTTVYILFIACVAHFVTVISIVHSIIHFFVLLGHAFANLGVYLWGHRIGTFLCIMGIMTIRNVRQLFNQVKNMEDRKAQRTQKTSYVLFFFWIATYVVFIAQQVTYFSYESLFKGMGVVLALITLVMLIFQIVVRRDLREDKVKLREQVKNDMFSYYRHSFIDLTTVEARHILGMAYLRNSWFVKGDKNDIAEKLGIIAGIVEKFLFESKKMDRKIDDHYIKTMRRSLLTTILINIDENLLKLLQRSHKQLMQNMTADEILKYCEILVTNKNLTVAKKNYKALLGEEKRKKEKKKELWLAFVRVLRKIVYPLAWLFKKMREKIDDFRMISKLFHEKCPYITKGKQLDVGHILQIYHHF